MPFFAVNYTYRDDAPALDQHRPAHRNYLGSLVDTSLVASGPLLSTTKPAALLIFRANDANEVTGLLDSDPFWTEGLIAERTIDEWNPVLGIFAE